MILTDGVHLISDDNEEELHAFARSIELKRSWFQPKSFPHYDLTTKRKVNRAIEAGAKCVTSRDLILVIRKRRPRLTWHPHIPLRFRNRIVVGDARELTAKLPAECVDLIFTDPPYLKKYQHLYTWLARESSRVLKPGGWMFAYGGAEDMPSVLDRLRMGRLDYFWTFISIHYGGMPRVWRKTLFSGYKPLFVFTKGKPAIQKWMSTTFHEAKPDKKFHKWQQSIGLPFKIIEMLTKPEAVIFDPLVGGGTTAIAAKMTGRNFIAFEIDPEAAKKARSRLKSAQLPLFAMEFGFEQLSFEGEIDGERDEDPVV